MDPITNYSSSPTWRRIVKRRPVHWPEWSPPSGGAAAVDTAAELRRKVEELEAAAERMRREKEAAESAAQELRVDLDAERGAAETAASEAMLMIERLQREKAAALMEARQFRRYAEGRADRERELQDELASLSDLVGSYRSRLAAHGIDPEVSSSPGTNSDDDAEDEEEEEGMNTAELENTAAAAAMEPESSGSSSNAMEKGILEEEELQVLEAMVHEEEVTDKEYEYTIDVGCATKAGAMEEYVGVARRGGRGGELAGASDLYMRLEVLEADRMAMRREIAALRAEKAQLVLMREMARRLCREVVAERSIVKKAPSTGSFSVFAICKWVLSVIFWRKKGSTARYTFGLSTTFLGLLLLLDRSTALSRWRRLPRPQG